MISHIKELQKGRVEHLAKKHTKIEIAQILNVPYQSIHRFCVKHDINCICKKTRRIGVVTEQDHPLIMERHKSGVPIKDIAIELNVRDNIIADIIRESKSPIPRIHDFEGKVVMSSDFRKRIGHFVKVVVDEGAIVLRCQHHGDLVLMTKEVYSDLKMTGD